MSNMIDMELIIRLKRAGMYQRKAVMELLPKGVDKHIDVIENELNMMLKEIALSLINGYSVYFNDNDEQDIKKDNVVKKVDIN